MGKLPNLTTSFEFKDAVNFDDPTIRQVGCYWGNPKSGEYEKAYPMFIADGEWFLGYQADPHCKEKKLGQYIGYINEIKVGDVLFMSHKDGSGVTVRAIGIVLYYKDLPIMEKKSKGEDVYTDKLFRVFKMAWTNSQLALKLPLSGFWDKGGSISCGYSLSELMFNKIPTIKDLAVQSSYKALMKEVDKARHRFLKLNLNNVTPKVY